MLYKTKKGYIMSVLEKFLILLVAFMSLAVIGYSGVLARPVVADECGNLQNEPPGIDKQQDAPCYTAQEATSLADAWVSAYSECIGPKDEVCTATYRQAEEVNRACRSADGCDQACKDACDTTLMTALDEYNNCVEGNKKPCSDEADLKVFGRPWPVCQ
jgi:hypothetical protein